MAPVSAAIVGAGAYAVKAMDEVDVGLDTLATKTGATKETAKDLQEVYKQVAEEVPGDFGDIGLPWENSTRALILQEKS